MKPFLKGFITIGIIGGVLVWAHLSRLPHGDLVVDFLDVGQGDAILFTLPDKERVLIDGGPNQQVLRELGAVMPFLDRRIDLVILTHPHADHVMGLVQVLKRYEVRAVLFTGLDYWSPIYDEFLQEVDRQEIPLYVARADQDWDFGEVYFDVLFPFESMAGTELENVNNGSIVTLVTYGENRLLLTGDAEEEVEYELVEAYGDELAAETLKAGHHGSRTASTEPFLDCVQPDLVVISVGEDNSFDHPHTETLLSLEDRDIIVRRTDEEGRIRLRFTFEVEGAAGYGDTADGGKYECDDLFHAE